MTAQPAAVPGRPASSTPATPAAPASDPLDLWRPEDGFLMQRGGEGLGGSGRARVETVPPGPAQLQRAAEAAERLLRDAAEGEVAVGALPYDGGVASRLWVPERALRATWAPGSVPPGSGGLGTPPPVPPGSGRLGTRASPVPPASRSPLRLLEEPAADEYAQAVAEAVRRIRAGRLEKVVLARSLRVEGAGVEDARNVLARLREAEPDCFTFGVSVDARSVLVGATPELLVRRRGLLVESHPMGGSSPRVPGAAEDRESGRRLLSSRKDRHEHALVVEAVAEALAPHCSQLDVPGDVDLVSTAGMWHLATPVRGRLRQPAPSALELAARLHPTPAICGTPRGAALAAIAELEVVPRGLYSGIAGWVDGRGDGEWVVSLRCALLGPEGARLHAGAGIVEGSDPRGEVEETRAKFGALLRALRAAVAGG